MAQNKMVPHERIAHFINRWQGNLPTKIQAHNDLGVLALSVCTDMEGPGVHQHSVQLSRWIHLTEQDLGDPLQGGGGVSEQFVRSAIRTAISCGAKEALNRADVNIEY